MAWHAKVRPGLLLLLILLLKTEAMTKGLYRYETAYACEGKILKIECNEGELIKLIRANYGRFSIAICNDHGHTDWSVNCMSPKSLRVLHGRCSQNQNCSIPASTSMFGDPCPGTHKYLEAHYQCLPAATTTTTNRPSPPWLITSQSPMWSTVKPSARPPIKLPPQITEIPSMRPSTSTTTVPNTTIYKPLPPIYSPSDTEDRINKDERNYPPKDVTVSFTTFSPRKTTPEDTEVRVSHTIPPNVVPFWKNTADALNFCSPMTVRTLFWNWTEVNTINVQPCPEGTTGYARWRCVKSKAGTPQWYRKTPDLSGCKSVWLNSFDQRIQSGKEPLATITNDLVQVASSKALYGGDMMITTKIIKALTRKTAQDIQTFPDARQREAFVTDMLKDVVNTSSYLIGYNVHATWTDLSYEDQMSVASSLLINLEENAFLLADTLTREKVIDQVFKNIMLSIRVLETKQVTKEKFPSENQWNDGADSIEIPKAALLDNSDGGLVRLVFVAYNGLEEILQWQADSSENSKNVSKVLNSKVICASLGKGRHIQLKEPVSLTFKHLRIDNVTNPSCVFWDYSINTWSNEGCYVDATNVTHTVCLCNHLTNFAILMDVEEIYLTLPFPHQIALEVITYVGCIISIVCLILAITIFQIFRGLKSDRTTIHCNLCVCLLIAEVLFLLGIEQTQDELTCGIIAGALHFFFLSAFAWMFFEGFQLYVMLVEVFEAEKSRLRWYYLFAYGAPFIIVLVSAIIYPQGYGTEKFCWLKTENNFIYTFVGPVSCVLALNLVFLSLAIVKMCIHANNSVSMKNKEHSRLASTRIWLKGAIILVFLLGLTWTFGLLYVNKESVLFAYIFSALNSLQGFFIFLFHCVQNEKVRKEYRKFIRRHAWLPRCLRCSKSSAGVNSSSGSSGLGKERRTSLYAGSNGNPSGSHSTDSPHGTSLQRGWNSKSCNNVNRVQAKSVPTSTSGNMAATLSHPPPTTPSPLLDNPNTSTLPYIRNFYKTSSPVISNLPKSASTWGPLQKPLHWKNISFKSYSRDSGHGGSEHEDSLRSQTMLNDCSRLNNAKDIHRQAYQTVDFSMNANMPSYPDYRMESLQNPKHLAQTLQPYGPRRKNGNMKPNWNHHTYTEIYEGRLPRCLVAEDDPVYEEIERNEIQISDMSDEDGKRQSDMSRQSSRSYGDNRPLIPCSPANDRSIMESMTPKRFAPEMDSFRMRPNNFYRGDARSLAAVLDGETVVCHLEPPDMYSRTAGLPPYSET